MTEVKPGSLVFWEFVTEDPTRTSRFLREVFGWETQSVPGLEYQLFAAPTGPGGAIAQRTGNLPRRILNYILSTDIEEDLRKIEKAGGKVRIGKTEIPNIGWWATFEEPTGLVLALFQSLAPDRGPVARYR
jgi:hypothetical protein